MALHRVTIPRTATSLSMSLGCAPRSARWRRRRRWESSLAGTPPAACTGAGRTRADACSPGRAGSPPSRSTRGVSRRSATCPPSTRARSAPRIVGTAAGHLARLRASPTRTSQSRLPPG
eukprot:30845-Pelagococcus_subviridis.AAC.13